MHLRDEFVLSNKRAWSYKLTPEPIRRPMMGLGLRVVHDFCTLTSIPHKVIASCTEVSLCQKPKGPILTYVTTEIQHVVNDHGHGP